MQEIDRREAVLKSGFWFVDVPRTSSSAIRSELGECWGSAHGKMNIPEKEFATSQLFPDHRSAREMRDILGSDPWSHLFTFSLTRNPWGRSLSFYFYKRTTASRKIPESWSLKDYLQHIAKARDGDIHPSLQYPPNYMTASEFLVDETGRLIVNEVVRYEERRDHLRRIGKLIGVEKLGARKLNSSVSDEAKYSDFYDPQSRDLVSKIFYDDCVRFGYSF